jgi:dihydropteroate synthase
MLLHCGSRILDLATPRVMGILNVTPDSFADGGYFADHQKAIAQTAAMIADGADIIDVGGESTRPGAALVSVEAELRRVIPVIEAIRAAHPEILISIDTSKPEVMQAAVAAGAGGTDSGCRMFDAHAGPASVHAGSATISASGTRSERVSGHAGAGLSFSRFCSRPDCG